VYFTVTVEFAESSFQPSAVVLAMAEDVLMPPVPFHAPPA